MSDATVTRSDDIIPADWSRKTLSALGDIRGGSTPRREVPEYWNGDIPWVTPGELTGLNSKYISETRDYITRAGLNSATMSLLPRNSLLVTTRATLGSVALAAVPITTNQGFRSIVFRDDADPHFFFHLFPRLRQELVRRASGTTFLEISGREFGTIEVPVPPLDEQRRIAEILDIVDETIRRTERVVAKLSQIKQGLLQNLMTRGVDEHGRFRCPEKNPERFRESLLGRIPREWRIVAVEDLFEMQLGKMLSKVAKRGSNPAFYLANRNIQWEYVDLNDLDWMDFSRAERVRYSLQPRDLLVCEGGEVGRTALWREERSDIYFQKAIHRLRRRNDAILPEYMLYFMRWATRERFFSLYTSQTSIAHLTQEQFARMPVLVPSVHEQKRIVAVLEDTNRRIETELSLYEKLRKLKQAIMDDLLTGKVRVPIPEEVAS